MSVEKVTPLLGFSWEPLLLPPREFLLMIPRETKTAHSHVNIRSGTKLSHIQWRMFLDILLYLGVAICPSAAGCPGAMRGNRSPWTGGAADWTAWQPERRGPEEEPYPSARTAPRSLSSGRPAGPAPRSDVWQRKTKNLDPSVWGCTASDVGIRLTEHMNMYEEVQSYTNVMFLNLQL